VLRRISGHKTVEVIKGWGKLHSEELHNLSSSPNIIRMLKSSRLRWSDGRTETCVQNSVGKPEGKRPLGRSRCR
jgi:hypothetical protein